MSRAISWRYWGSIAGPGVFELRPQRRELRGEVKHLVELRFQLLPGRVALGLGLLAELLLAFEPAGSTGRAAAASRSERTWFSRSAACRLSASTSSACRAATS